MGDSIDKLAAMANLTPDKFVAIMERLAEIYAHAPDAFHARRDSVMVAILHQQGYGAGLEVGKDIPLWAG